MRPSGAARSIRASAPVFAALGDETRLQLVARLCTGGPQSIARLTEGANVTRQAVSKHLRVLEGVGLVRAGRDGRDGRETLWEIEPRRLDDARRALDLIGAQWDAAMGRLRAFVEE